MRHGGGASTSTLFQHLHGFYMYIFKIIIGNKISNQLQGFPFFTFFWGVGVGYQTNYKGFPFLLFFGGGHGWMGGGRGLGRGCWPIQCLLDKE